VVLEIHGHRPVRNQPIEYDREYTQAQQRGSGKPCRRMCTANYRRCECERKLSVACNKIKKELYKGERYGRRQETKHSVQQDKTG
jgi:hypothetical protein